MIHRSLNKTYDPVTRFFHWTMAALIIWQLGGMLAEKVCGETPFIKAWTGTHSSIGLILLVLAVVRLIWAMAQRKHHPAYSISVAGSLARITHKLFYALMIIIPAIALMRSIGSGRGVKFFGAELLAPTGEKIPALIVPANAAHGLLGWVLLALIAGHITMALFHHFALKDGTLAKILPSLRRQD